MRTKKTFYNIISELVFQIVAFVCGLVFPRLVLESYGSAYNGVIQTIIQFVGYISILTMGVAGPTRVAIYKALADKDDHKVNAVLKANDLFMRKVSLALVGYMLVLAVVYPYLVREQFGWWEIALLVVIIGMGELAEYLFGNTSRILLGAHQESYVYMMLLTGSKIVSTISAAILIINGFSIHAVRLAMVASFAAAPIITNIYVRRKYHIRRDVEPDFSALEQRGDAIAHSLADIVNRYTGMFLLAIMTNPITISIYSIYNLILENLIKVQQAFTNNLEAVFGDIWARGEKEKFAEKLSTLEYLMYAFLLLVYTTTGSLILPFMRIYTDEVTDANYILPVFAALFVASTAAYSLRDPYIVAVQSAGRYRDTRKLATREAFLNVTLSALGIWLWGLNGLVFAALVANLYRTIGYAIYIYRTMLGMSMARFVGRWIWMLGSGAVILGLQLLLVNRVLVIDSWMMWAVGGVCCVAVALAVTLFSSAICYRQELRNAAQLVKAMLKRA